MVILLYFYQLYLKVKLALNDIWVDTFQLKLELLRWLLSLGHLLSSTAWILSKVTWRQPMSTMKYLLCLFVAAIDSRIFSKSGSFNNFGGVIMDL